jgi:hypothetical protein
VDDIIHRYYLCVHASMLIAEWFGAPNRKTDTFELAKIG